MPLIDDIAAIRADSNRTDRRKQIDIYSLKVEALRDVIINGKPAPNPIPPVLGRTFTLDGKTIRVNVCTVLQKEGSDGELVPTLYIDVTVNGVTHQIYYTNPPVLPRSPGGNEKQDLIQCASEMLAQLPVT